VLLHSICSVIERYLNVTLDRRPCVDAIKQIEQFAFVSNLRAANLGRFHAFPRMHEICVDMLYCQCRPRPKAPSLHVPVV
jgi:hypothetical protein